MTNVRWLVVPMVSMMVAGCGGAPAEEPTPTQPHANLLQLMAAIPFPNSNVVYDTQVTDPAAEPDPANADAAAATVRYGSTYGGWQGVEIASLAVAETANLLLIPGRVCSNGRPVPVEAEDFRQWTQELADAGLESYRVAQTRDLEAMFEVTDTLTLACGNCHDKYRDVDDRCAP